MANQSVLYGMLKGKAYPLLSSISGYTTADAKRQGYKDIWDLLLSDSDHSRMATFMLTLPSQMSVKQRQVLLDGLAREYAECDGWMEYVERETRD